MNDWFNMALTDLWKCKWSQSFPTLLSDVLLKHLAYFAALVVLEVKPYEFVRTNVIVVNLVFLECSEVPVVGMFKVS